MIGKLIIPTKDNIAAYLSPLVLFSNELDNIIIPKYVVFSGISIVKTGRDVKKWETVFQRKF